MTDCKFKTGIETALHGESQDAKETFMKLAESPETVRGFQIYHNISETGELPIECRECGKAVEGNCEYIEPTTVYRIKKLF